MSNQVFIIAEAGVNHNGDESLAFELIDAAVAAGADAVKFQTFNPVALASVHADKASYQKCQDDGTSNQLEMLSRLALPLDIFYELKAYCETKGIHFLSTPFDLKSADFLMNELGLDVIKIASGEITNAPLLYEIALTGSNTILSTGMCLLGEIETALGVLAYGYLNGAAPSVAHFKQAYLSDEGQQLLRDKVTLLHCSTDYPVNERDVNLKAIQMMQAAFGLTVGYSDHSIGIGVSLGAVALGACVIEKHFTLDKNLPGPDHAASLSVNEFTQLVVEIRRLEAALGHSRKLPSIAELENAEVARKSLVANQKIEKNEPLTKENLSVKRPGTGVSPLHYWQYLDRMAERDYAYDDVL